MLRLGLRRLDGREVMQDFRFKFLRQGYAGWMGLITAARP